MISSVVIEVSTLGVESVIQFPVLEQAVTSGFHSTSRSAVCNAVSSKFPDAAITPFFAEYNDSWESSI
jgi:hypothetical protein